MTDATVTLNLLDALGEAYDASRTKIWVEFNTDNGFIVDEDGNTRVGAGRVTINSDGSVQIAGIPVPSVATNPPDFQVRISYDAPPRAAMQRSVKRDRGTFGWMTITEDADLADLVAEQYAPPSWQSTIIAQAQAILAQQESLAGIDDTDTAVAYAVEFGTETPSALSASIASEVTGGFGDPTSDIGSAAVDLFGRVYTPEQFGAVGDGTTDDGAAFTAAYAAMPAGSILLLRPGRTYYARITPASNTQTVGHGATLKAPTGSTAVLVNAAAKVNVSIYGLALNGNSVAVHGVHSTIGTTDLTLVDVETYGCTERGIYLENVVRATLTRCLARNNGASNNSHAGINIQGQQITVTDCIAHTNTVGFRIVSSASMQSLDIALTGCIGYSNTRYNFVSNAGDFTLRPNRVTLTGCIGKSSGNGYSNFSMHGILKLAMSACVSELSGEHGFTVQDSAGTTLSGLVAYTARGFGLRLQGDFSRAEDAYTGVRQAVVTGCLLVGNGTANPGGSSSYGGIFIDTYGEDIHLADNLVYNNNGAALRITPRTTPTVFTDPVRVTCSGNVFRSNTFDVVTTSLSTAALDTYSGFNFINGVRKGFGSTQGGAILHGTAAPTTGTWAQGDIVWNSTPTAGGRLGWICTTPGTPGTWSTLYQGVATATTAALASAAHAINTTAKQQGRTVFNTNTNKLVTATGSATTDTWVDATGTVAHTPV